MNLPLRILAAVGVGTVSGQLAGIVHNALHPAPPAVEPPRLVVQEAYPSDVWAPDVVGPVIESVITDLQHQATRMGKVPDWGTLKVSCTEFGLTVAVSGSVSVVT